MRISAKTDYAIRALVELAVEPGRPLTCEAIASSQGIPYRFLKAVLRDLRVAGLVRSQRGCDGGYWLGRDPESLRLSEVVAAIDGGLMSVHGELSDGPGYPPPAQRISLLWRAMRERIEQLLAGVTIADLLTDTPDGEAASLLRPAEGTPAGKYHRGE